jgi:hypothetical protein
LTVSPEPDCGTHDSIQTEKPIGVPRLGGQGLGQTGWLAALCQVGGIEFGTGGLAAIGATAREGNTSEG